MKSVAQAAESAYVGWRLERLREHLRGPLAVVGVGGSHAAAMFWARLHEASGDPGWSVTPYDFVERALPTGANVLLLSLSGRHHDMLAAARSARARAARVFAVVGDRSAPMCSVVRDRQEDDVLVVSRPPPSAGIVEHWGPLAMYVLAAQVYTHVGPYPPLFDVPLAPPPAARPAHVYCLGAGLGRVAAEDFARLLQESDVARASAHDVRDFAHGNFFPATRPGALAAVFAQGDQRDYAAQVHAILAPTMPTLAFETADAGVPGGLQLAAQARGTHAHWAEAYGATPTREDIPDWAVKLYHLPFSRTG